MSSPITPQQLLARLRVLAVKVDRVPSDARTIMGWAKVWGVSFGVAAKYIRVALRARQMCRVWYRIRTARGHVVRKDHYTAAKDRS